MKCPKCGKKIISYKCDKCGWNFRNTDILFASIQKESSLQVFSDSIKKEREEKAKLEERKRQEEDKKKREESERIEKQKMAEAEKVRQEKEKREQEEKKSQEAERKAREERNLREAENRAREARERQDAERRTKEEADRLETERIEKEERGRQEAERRAREEQDRQVANRLAKEKQEQLEAARAARAARAEQTRIEKERKSHLERNTRICFIFNLIFAICVIALLFWKRDELFHWPACAVMVGLGLMPFVAYVFVKQRENDKYETIDYIIYLTASIMAFGFMLNAIGIKTVIYDWIIVGKLTSWIFPIAMVTLNILTTIRHARIVIKNDKSINYVIGGAFGLSCVCLAVLLFSSMKSYVEDIYPIEVHNVIQFGRYEQNNNMEDGEDELSWTVHKLKDADTALLVCDSCIYALPYNDSGSDNSWTESTLRSWLNTDFYTSAFTSEEQSIIKQHENSTGRLSDESSATIGETYGEDELTSDKIFVPDLSETWMNEGVSISDYALNIYFDFYEKSDNYERYWTRCPYGEKLNWANGAVEGKDAYFMLSPNEYAFVRPCFYANVHLLNAYINDDEKRNPGGGWGDSADGRESYSISEINNGALDGIITFNSISDGKIGDEKNFVAAKISGADVETWNANSMDVSDGETYTIRLYVHNNNPGGMNAIAKEVIVTFSIPTVESDDQTVIGYLNCSNATPDRYWDAVTLKGSERFYLEYLEGSAKYYNNTGEFDLPDEVITSGAKLGYNELNGEIPGCYEYDGVATIDVVVHNYSGL